MNLKYNNYKTIRYWLTILCLLILALIVIHFLNQNDVKIKIIENNAPTYKINYNNTFIYSLNGILNYHLVTQHIECFSKQRISWFTKPSLTIYNKNKIPIWLIKCDLAKLTHDYILYLYNHVEVDALNNNFQLYKIITENAKINLLTQYITSQDTVTLYGTTFRSTGLKMNISLCKKNAKLIKKVITLYEI